MNKITFSTVRICLLMGSCLLAGTVSALEQDACDNESIPRSTPSSDFAVVEPGVVLHQPTGLLWQRCVLGRTWQGDTCVGEPELYEWQEALLAADQVDGWRLPNINELMSLVEECRFNSSINQVVFSPVVEPGYLWSATPTLNVNLRVYRLGFNAYGQVDRTERDDKMQVRLVRDY